VPGIEAHGALHYFAHCGLVCWASSYEAAAGAMSLDESLRQKERREGGPGLLSGK
jgi:hypothetical protein